MITLSSGTNCVMHVTSSSSEAIHGCVWCRVQNYVYIFTNQFGISVAFIAPPTMEESGSPDYFSIPRMQSAATSSLQTPRLREPVPYSLKCKITSECLAWLSRQPVHPSLSRTILVSLTTARCSSLVVQSIGKQGVVAGYAATSSCL